MMIQILQGDCLDTLKTLPDESVQCCVTSPPYWNLRDYGCVGQIGIERTPIEYTNAMVEVFREVRRVLRADGTLWLNLGDTYIAPRGNTAEKPGHDGKAVHDQLNYSGRGPMCGLKVKDLCGIPWRVAFALQGDGWYLRQDIIWSKPNPMPESVTDRCTKAHEYIFLLSKSARYYYDADAIKEQAAWERWGDQTVIKEQQGTASWIKPKSRTHLPGNKTHKGTTAYENGDVKHRTKAGLVQYAERQRENAERVGAGQYQSECLVSQTISAEGDGATPSIRPNLETRNKRSVWTVTTSPFPEAHFATFPPDLIEPCIKAGSREGDTVLDPFSGAGTTGLVASRFGRNYIGIELNPAYVEMSKKRIESDAPMFNQVEPAKPSEPTQSSLLVEGEGIL